MGNREMKYHSIRELDPIFPKKSAHFSHHERFKQSVSRIHTHTQNPMYLMPSMCQIHAKTNMN
jgi:hypothetical protein